MQEKIEKCPSGPEYNELVTAVGKDFAYRAWLANGKEVPSTEDARRIIKQHQNIQEGLKDKVIDTEIDKLAAEIGTAFPADHPLHKVIDSYVDNLGAHIRKLIKNENFVELRKILTPEGKEKPILTSTKALMQQAQDHLNNFENSKGAVSYTHLTLPTIYSV